MKTPRQPLAHSIETLESRIAPAALTFTDLDGDMVKIIVSQGTNADLTAAAKINGQQLQELRLAPNPIFDGADVTVKVIGGTGDGLANLGFLNAKGLDLDVVKIMGDLGRC
jgi:hypothetical protein